MLYQGLIEGMTLQPILCPLIEELKTFGFPSDNNLCNLRVIGECFSLVSEMMGLLHELVGSCQDAVYKLFTQFHANYPKHEREWIVQDLVSGKSKLRLPFVTVAFGIGVDVNNIREVIHIGVPHSIEEYFQEAGRGGRDRLPACSTIYYNSYDLAPSQNLSAHMNDLVKADKCKREIILNCTNHPCEMVLNIHAVIIINVNVAVMIASLHQLLK